MAAELYALIVWACEAPMITRPERCGQVVVRDVYYSRDECQEGALMAEYVVDDGLVVTRTQCEPQKAVRAQTGPIVLFPAKEKK